MRPGSTIVTTHALASRPAHHSTRMASTRAARWVGSLMSSEPVSMPMRLDSEITMATVYEPSAPAASFAASCVTASAAAPTCSGVTLARSASDTAVLKVRTNANGAAGGGASGEGGE